MRLIDFIFGTKHHHPSEGEGRFMLYSKMLWYLVGFEKKGSSNDHGKIFRSEALKSISCEPAEIDLKVATRTSGGGSAWEETTCSPLCQRWNHLEHKSTAAVAGGREGRGGGGRIKIVRGYAFPIKET